MTTGSNWARGAKAEGWTWSSAHGGYISERHRRQGSGWDSYIVADTAEDACFMDGIETEDEALRRALESETT